MESYDASVDLIADTWLDTWTISTSKAEILLNIADANLAIDGNSMEFNYNNDAVGGNKRKYSWTEALASDLQAGTDWTVGEAKALVLNFYGQAGNSAQPLYVVVEDGGATEAMVTYDDANGTQEEEWHEWNIDLEDFNSAGVDLTDVNKITLGIGVRGEVIPGGGTGGGEGTVYFDSFGLYPTRCVASASALYGDSDGDCIVDGIDLSAVARDWLESSGWVAATAPDANYLQGHYRFEEGTGQFTANESGYNGMLGNTDVVDACDPLWITSDPCAEHINCLEFDGTEHVEIPPFNFNTDTLTITAWIQRDGTQEIFAGVVAATDPCSNTKAALQFGSTPSWKATNTLNYTWPDDGPPYTWEFESNLFIEDGLWYFVAVTIAPTEGILYMYDGLEMQSAKNLDNYHHVEEFDCRTDIGWSRTKGPGKRHFVGRIDDVHIYDYTLSAGEVLYVADPIAVYYHNLEDWRMDVDDSGAVDFGDFAIQADYWLQEVLWP
ncbi:MAG: LamG domain-containing protein [Planctomycetota bacterium]|jgi:hypothetical protein